MARVKNNLISWWVEINVIGKTERAIIFLNLIFKLFRKESQSYV